MCERPVMHPTFRDLGRHNLRRSCPVLLHLMALRAAREKRRFVAARRIPDLFLRRNAGKKNAVFEFLRSGHASGGEIVELSLDPFADFHPIRHAADLERFGGRR